MKKFILLGILAPAAFFSQTLNHQTAITSKAERHLQFKVTDAPNDVMEIGNSTALNNEFQPTIWIHKESSTGPVMVLSGNITSSVDNGSTPIINLVAGKDIFDNGAPNSSQFPWGNGGTTLPIVNRPIFAISNAFNRVLTTLPNGNIGIGTSNPLSKLHTVGSVRFQSLPTIISRCLLLENSSTGEIGLGTGCASPAKQALIDANKTPSVTAINTVKKIDTFEYIDAENNLFAVYDSNQSKITDGDYQKLIPYLIESIKELNTKIEILEGQLRSKENAISNNDVKVYPNPVKDIFNIYFDKIENTNYSVKIYDNTGKLIINKTEIPKNQKMSINVSNFSSGMYLYEVLNNKGEIKKGKFIKE